MTYADPTIRAHLENVRVFISRYRRSYSRWLPLSIVIGPPIAVLLSLTPSFPVNLLDIVFYGPFAATLTTLIYYITEFPKQRIHCPSCSQIPLSHEWVCGACHRTNKHGAWPTRKTFAEACRFSDCKKVPHSIICPICRRPILFTDGADPKTSAWLPGYPPPPHVPEAPAEVEDRPPKRYTEHLH